MKTGARALGWLRGGVLGVFALALLAGLFLPVYTDEIGWRFQERAGIDDVDKLFSDGCGANTLAAPPFFMMPARLYSAFFNTRFADPFYIRLSGLLYALTWLALLVVLIRRAVPARQDRAAITTVGAGLLCLGTLPLLLVWSRPEQPIVLALTAALILALASESDPAPAAPRTAWLRSAAILVLAGVAFSYHIKAFFLTPLFLASLVFASRGPRAIWPRLVVGAAICAMAAASAAYWIHRLQCPGDPFLKVAYSSNNFGMALTNSRNLGEVLAALGKIAGNVALDPYFRLPAPQPRPLSYWLEAGQIGKDAAATWATALAVAWWAAMALALIGFAAGLWRAWRTRRLDPRLVLALVLLATVLGWSATQSIRNVYEAGFVLPLAMLVVVLALAGREPAPRWVRVLTAVLAAVLGLGALASPVLVAGIYGPSLERANAQPGYVAAQPFSLSVFGYSALEPDIRAAARQCGIGDPARARALMVDDLTYLAFMRSRLPQHQLGVVGLWRGTIQDPVAYLRSRGSSGAILRCDRLPPDLRRRAKRQGGFCCLGPPNW